MSVDNVNDIEPRDQYTAIAAQTEFDYTFPIFEDGDLAVYVDGALQALTTDYTVTGEGDDAGGTITFLSAMTGGEVVTIYRDLPIERTTDFQTNGPNRSSSMNDELDRLTMVMQQLERDGRRAIRFPLTSAIDSDDLELNPTSYASKYLAFDSDGKPEPAALSAETMTQSTIGALLNPQTAAEIAAGVTPVDYSVPSHDVVGYIDPRRYITGGSPTVEVDATTGLQHAATLMAYLDYATIRIRWPLKITSAITIPDCIGCSVIFSDGGYVRADAAMSAMFTFSGTAASSSSELHADAYGSASAFYPIEDFKIVGQGALNADGNANVILDFNAGFLNVEVCGLHFYYPKTHAIKTSQADSHEIKIHANKFTCGISPYTHPGSPYTYGGTYYDVNVIELQNPDFEVTNNIVRSGNNGVYINLVDGSSQGKPCGGLITGNHIFRAKNAGIYTKSQFVAINHNYFDMNETYDILVENVNTLVMGKLSITNNIFLQDSGAYMFGPGTSDPYYIYFNSPDASTLIRGVEITNNIFNGSRSTAKQLGISANCSWDDEGIYIHSNGGNFITTRIATVNDQKYNIRSETDVQDVLRVLDTSGSTIARIEGTAGSNVKYGSTVNAVHNFYRATSTGTNALIQGLSDYGGSNTTNFKVSANGDVTNTNNSYGAISDERLKENISPARSQWDDIKRVELVNFSLKADGLKVANQLGVIAQQLERSGMDKLVQEVNDFDDSGNVIGNHKEVKYSVLLLKALGALKEAITRIELLESRKI